jgi:hypothetical protein
LFTSDEETEQVRAHVVYHPQDEEGPWTSVQCQRAHSFDSAIPREARITTPVDMPNKFDKQRVNLVRRDSLILHGEGPSEKKGKGPDPQNWENIGLNDQDINKDVQQALLNMYKLEKIIFKVLSPQLQIADKQARSLEEAMTTVVALLIEKALLISLKNDTENIVFK